MIATLLPLFGLLASPLGPIPDGDEPGPPVLDEHGRWPAPTELFAVEKVVDGDTIHIRRDGEYEKLRLLSVDTEEKLSFQGSPSKPGTVFGEETSLWAQDLFDELGDEPTVGLRFPHGIEARDVYGRLLCHVVLPDGTDFNVLLVREGKSPYFDKYGRSRICHDAFVAAEEEARAKELGVWNPRTNEPRTPGAPAAKRPYDRLLPWWEARALAIDAFRAADADDDLAVCDAGDPTDVAESLAAGRERVRVFAELFRTFDEDDGSLTLLLRGDKDRAVRVIVPKEARDELGFDLAAVQDEFRQNFFWSTGRLVKGRRGGFELHDASGFELAGPEPGEVARPEPTGAER